MRKDINLAHSYNLKVDQGGERNGHILLEKEAEA
jgi:hypothetical protein